MIKYIILLFFSIPTLIVAEHSTLEVGIAYKEHLGKFIPLDLRFEDSESNTRTLKDIINKPTVLSLVYYHCPGICSPLLTSLAELVDSTDKILGKDYQLLTISFDPSETSELAAKWKKSYLDGMERKINPKDWMFVVSDSTNIAKITNSVGFKYKRDGDNDFLHPGALIMISEKGEIIRYLLGTNYDLFSFNMAISEMNNHLSSSLISKFQLFIYSYDPQLNKYVFNFVRVAVTLLILLVVSIFFTIYIKGKKKTNI